MNIIGINGKVGSGKTTIAEYIHKKYNYDIMSFADPLKDCVSAIFGWDRELLQGDTQISRSFRETKDDKWSKLMQGCCSFLGQNVVEINLGKIYG